MSIFKTKTTKLIFSYLVFASCVFIFHLLINFSDDDLIFGKVLDNTNCFDYVIERYNLWSSRVFIEFILIFVSRNIWIWRIVDTLLIVLLIYSINRIVFKKSTVYNTILTMLICCSYPFFHLKSAGYCATTLNYSWILSLMLFSFIPLRNIFYNEKINYFCLPLYILSAIFACNQEQAVCVVLTISIVSLIYCVIKQKKYIYPLILLIIAILSLTFILTCPGNQGRSSFEIGIYFPNFAELSFFHKIYLGIMVGMSTLFKGPFVVLLFSFVCLLYALYSKANKNIFVLICCYLILCLFINVSYLDNIIFGRESNYISYALLDTKSISPNDFSINTIFNIEFLLNIVIIAGSFIIPILLLKKKSLGIVLLLLLGYGTRLILCFSPTLVASASRTTIFLLFAFIISSLYLCSKYYLHKPYKKILFTSVSLIALLTIILSIANILKPLLVN